MLTPARYLREHVLEMSQTELARALKISQPGVAKIEAKNGKFPERHRDTIRELAKAKGKTIPDIDFEKVPLKQGR